MTAFILSHMPLWLVIIAVLAAAAAPAFMLKTTLGRYLLITVGVIACVWWVSNARFSAGRAACNAEHEAAAAIAEADAAKAALGREDKSADATAGARYSADTRKAKQAADTARVKGYADSVSDDCSASPDILRELQAKADDLRSAEARLRDLRRPNK